MAQLFLNRRIGVWRRRGKAASADLSAAPYSAHHGLYLEAVVSSVASAVALAEVGRFREAVDYVQKAAKALYEAAREAFERVKVSLQRLVELFVEAVTRVLAWIDEHKAYLFLMAAAAAGVVALSVALNLWGLVEMEKLAHAAVGAPPFFVGLADVGEKAAERFGAAAERHERWKMEEKVVSEIINAPLKRERPFLKLTRLKNLPKPLAELRNALKDIEDKTKIDEVEKDAAVVAALVLYKTLVKNAEVYGKWAELYKWARSLVGREEFTVSAEEVKRLREAQKRLEEVAEEVRRELNTVLTLYSQSDFYKERSDLLNKLKSLLEVDLGMAEELAVARRVELSRYSNANMGTKAYAALLSVARGGAYGHAAMLLMIEEALADVVLLTPTSAYNKAKRIAKGRGEAVDPSYSGRRGRSVGQPSWEDRAASALLRYLLGRAVNEDLIFRRVEGGFEVFRAYGGVEVPVDALKIGETVASSKAGEEALRRFMEEAKKHKPDLSGIRKMWHALEWFATDVSFAGRRIEAATADTRQAAWYIALFGEPESTSGRASVTEEGVKPNVTMYWPRERLDSIIAEEGEELKPLLGRAVNSWRELVDAINWSQVLKKVEELVDELKPWIGPEGANEAEREGLARRMLGELALITHFAEARRGMDDGRWREERAKRLVKAVEALSGGRIVGDHAEELAKAIIYNAEGQKKRARRRIESLVREVGVSREEVWGVVDFVLGDMYCLARDCADDKNIRKFVAPALELIMLDKALRGEFDRERAKFIFGEMYATALAGDGYVGPGAIMLVVGGELGGGAALLRLATLHLLNQLLPDGQKFGIRTYIDEGVYNIAATGENAVGLRRLLAVSAPSAGGGYLSEKFNEFMKETQVEVQFGNIRLTPSGLVAADLTISEGDAAVKYNVYLRRDEIVLQFQSSDRSRVEHAARLLRLAGVTAEVRKEGGRDVWYVRATTDKLAAGREELRKALAEIVREAIARGWVEAGKAEGWLEKLEGGRMLMEGWPKYYVGLSGGGALEVKYQSTNPDSIAREAQRLRAMGLKEGKHFTVKMPEGEKAGHVSILREGLERAAWLSVNGTEGQRDLAARFVEYILQRAEEAGEEVSEKAKKIIEEGKTRGSLKLEGFEKKVEVNGKTYVVKVIGGEAVEEDRDGRKLLRIRITAEVGRVKGEHTIVDRVVREYTITFGRYGRNAALGFAVPRADVPGGREADAERFAAVIEALTGVKPRIRRRSDGRIELVCGREHLDGFARFAELTDAIERWLEETRR